jgi:hypothetical protein
LGGGSSVKSNSNIGQPIKLVQRGLGSNNRFSDASSKKSMGGGSAMASGNGQAVYRMKRSQINELKTKS